VKSQYAIECLHLVKTCAWPSTRSDHPSNCLFDVPFEIWMLDHWSEFTGRMIGVAR
jgi:hypothetical protein